jgi:hypothetical protein
MNTVLNDYMLNEVSNITYDFVKTLVQQVKRHDICTYVCHFVCDHVLTNNIWIIKKVKEYLEVIDTCKQTERDKQIRILYSLFHLLGNSDKGIYTFYYPHEKSNVFLEDIKNIRFTSGTHDIHDLSQLQQVLTDEVYTLLNVMYECFLYSVESTVSLQKCFVILRYLLTLSPRHYIQGTTKGVSMDIIDFVFLICVWYGDNVHCTQELKMYISDVKDIFYYKLKKKDKLIRINTLFYLIYVIINKRVRNQEIDYEGANIIINEVIDKSKSETDSVEEVDVKYKNKIKNEVHQKDEEVINKCQYLYIYMDYDQQLMYEMERERDKNRMMSKLMRTATKEVEVDGLLMKDHRNDVSITKLSV